MIGVIGKNRVNLGHKTVEPVFHHAHFPDERSGFFGVVVRPTRSFSERVVEERLHDHVLRYSLRLQTLTRHVKRAIYESSIFSWEYIRKSPVVVRIAHQNSISDRKHQKQIPRDQRISVMSDENGFRRDLKGAAREQFGRSALSDRFMTGVQRERAQKVLEIERRAAQVRERARKHFQKMKPVWEKAERNRLAQARQDKPVLSRIGGPNPPGQHRNRQQSRQQALTNRAEVNVKARCDERLRMIQKIENRMVRKLNRSRNR